MICPACEVDTADAKDFCPACGQVYPVPLVDEASSAETMMAPTASITGLIGRVVDGFRFDAILGGGSFGTVFRAVQLALDRPAAIKVPTHEVAADPVNAKRFAREARAAAKVTHPGVVAIYHVGDLPDGRPYMAMQLVDGQPLDKLVAEGPLPPARALAIARLIASALAETHAADIVHRDLKPSNVIWRKDRAGDDRVTLVDFGIAMSRAPGEDAARLTSGGLIGTPHYMSPEQCHGETVDARSDLYSLGCLLFELLTGKPPFIGPAMEVLLAHNSKPAPAAGVSDRIDGFVARLLAKRPEDRPQSAGDVVVAIDGLKRSARSTVSLRRSREPSWRIGAVIAVLAVGAVAYAGVTLARAPDGVEDEPADEPTAPVDPHGNARRQVLDDDGELTFRALLPEPVLAHESVGFHLELWNKLGQPIDAPELVVTIEDPHGIAAGLSAKGHGAKEKRHYGFHYRFPSAGHYAVRVFPPGSSSTFQLDVSVEP